MKGCSKRRLRAGFDAAVGQQATNFTSDGAEHNDMPNVSRECSEVNTIIMVKEGNRSETNGVGTKHRHELCQGLTFKRLEVFDSGLRRMFEPRPMRSGCSTDDARCQIEEV